ncbi:GDP-L-fucose synthase [Fodinibacter luteus]|uniref:GDP-L-fucose synthase n=1 Tax=Fodinibacter luteus TaxID=552064 RepID=A0ABP8KKS6_9MICO
MTRPWTPQPLDREARFYVAGHRGLAGGALWRHLQREGFTNLLGRGSQELDLRRDGDVRAFFEREQPRYVVLAAARVGGIAANAAEPVEFLSDNLRIQVNVLDAAHTVGVERLLFLGSSCIYPRLAAQPITEDSLLTGPLEETNKAYAIAKIAGVMHVQAMRREHGHAWISAMPTNLYGPGDNYDAQSSHVLAALIRRFDEAVRSGGRRVTNWGTGAPRREFLHVDDLAGALVALLERYDDDSPVNVGTGSDLTIAELAELVAAATGYAGEVAWDPSRPDGTPRKLLDVSRLHALGWRHGINLEAGIAATVDSYRRGRDQS